MAASPRKTPFLQSLAGLCLAAAITLPVCAQTVLVAPPRPLLPKQFGSWQMQNDATTGTEPAQADAARAAQLNEDGLSRFSTARYQHGSASLDVKALQFVDATGASAALSLYRAATPALKPLPPGVKLGVESAASDTEALFRGDNTIVIATGTSVPTHDLQPLAIGLPKISGPRGLSPLLPTLLPAKGLAPESVRYSLGPVGYAATGGILPPDSVGFDKAAEAVTASYTAHSGKGTLTLLLYPTPQIAAEHGRTIEVWANTHPVGQATIKLRREGPLVLMIIGSFAPEEAQQMIENIHLRTEVTFDKKPAPEFHAEVRKTASLLVSILTLSGLLMLAAILLAAFLGGGRAAIRVMRGKSAATEVEFLGLGLERGPVKALDRSDGRSSK